MSKFVAKIMYGVMSDQAPEFNQNELRQVLGVVVEGSLVAPNVIEISEEQSKLACQRAMEILKPWGYEGEIKAYLVTGEIPDGVGNHELLEATE